jgi:hypothetical protein
MTKETQSVSRRMLLTGAAGATVLAKAAHRIERNNLHIARRNELQG